ncbi:MAG TPA: TolC family protein [Gemmataceae bacterium]|nr:TolC family protein [Gemmataceae bacterium]
MPMVVAETREVLPTTYLVRAAGHETSAAPSAPLGLSELLDLARQQNPDLAMAAARVTEAQGQFVQAGLYPNPTVGYIGNQINDGPGTAGQQGVFVSQEVVSGGKLEVARLAAGHGLTAADWQAVSRWNETTARVRGAYYEYLTARAILRETEGIIGQFEAGLRKAESLAAAGMVFNYEVRRFRIELTQARNRVGTARERLAAAERLVAGAIGLGQLPAPVAAADLPIPAHAVDFEQAVAASEGGSYLREAAALTDQAREQVRLADLQNLPNLQVQTAGMYDFAIQAPIANVQVGVTLPIWHHNEGNILAAQGRLAQAQAGVGQARVRVRERLAAVYQKYRNARRQMDLYEKEILPDARAALEQVEKVYEAKGERFFETLDARRVLAQARIDYLQALGDCWQALSEIEGLTQPADKR